MNNTIIKVFLVALVSLSYVPASFSQTITIDSLPLPGKASTIVINDMVSDSAGGAWVLTTARLLHVDSTMEIVESIRLFSLPNPQSVLGLQSDGLGNIYLLRVDGLLKYEDGEWTQTLNLPEEKIYGTTNGLAFTKNGEPILTISQFGLVHQTSTGLKTYTEADFPNLDKPNGMLVDNDGHFWVHVPGTGIVTNKSGSWQAIKKPQINSPTGNLFITTMYTTTSGRRLAGSFHGPLFELNDDLTATTLVNTNSWISDIEETDQDIWYCTFSSMLKGLNGTLSNEIASIEDQFVNHDFRRMLFMNERHVWLGTTKHGIISINFNGKPVDRVRETHLVNFEIYPNPTNSHIQVTILETDWRNANISVLTQSGQVLKTYPTQSAAMSLDVSFLPPGSYFLRLNTATGTNTKIFIKE